MTRDDAIRLFRDMDGRNGVRNLAAAMSVTRQAIYKWPEELPARRANEVIGALLRLGLGFRIGIGEEPEYPDDIFDNLKQIYRERMKAKRHDGNGFPDRGRANGA